MYTRSQIIYGIHIFTLVWTWDAIGTNRLKKNYDCKLNTHQSCDILVSSIGHDDKWDLWFAMSFCSGSQLCVGCRNKESFETRGQNWDWYFFAGAQLFQLLGELWSCYNKKWFSSHCFGFGSSEKLKFGLTTPMT